MAAEQSTAARHRREAREAGAALEKEGMHGYTQTEEGAGSK